MEVGTECDPVESDPMGRAGREKRGKSAEKPGVHEPGGNKSGNIAGSATSSSPLQPPPDSDLAKVVAAWAALSPALRAAILALVNSAT